MFTYLGSIFAEGLQDACHTLALATGRKFLANVRVLILACKIECDRQRLLTAFTLSLSLSKTDQVTDN